MMPHIIYHSGLKIPSQKTDHIDPNDEDYILGNKLPVLVKIWGAIEQVTGHRWHCTSFIRGSDAPSHVDGSALDIAPEFNPSAKFKYAGSRLSDPILYKREKLMRALQRLAKSYINDSPFDIGLFVEPDHIHIGIFRPASSTSKVIRVFKWGVVKPLYNDSPMRSKLPLITT